MAKNTTTDASSLLDQVMQQTGMDVAALVKALKGLLASTPEPAGAPPLSHRAYDPKHPKIESMRTLLSSRLRGQPLENALRSHYARLAERGLL